MFLVAFFGFGFFLILVVAGVKLGRVLEKLCREVYTKSV